MDGDPIVRQIVKKLYGDEEEYAESVVLYEHQVVVSRETLKYLFELAYVGSAETDNPYGDAAKLRELELELLGCS